MSININSNQLGNIANTYNNAPVNNAPVNNGQVHGDGQINADDFQFVDKPDVGAQPQINGGEALGGAEVRPLAAEIRARVPARHSFFKSLTGLGKAIGRAFMRACHVINNLFTGAIPKQHRSDFEVAMRARHADEGLATVSQNDDGDVFNLSNGTRVNKNDVVTYSDEEIGAAMGLKGPVTGKSFSEADINQIIMGDFRLDDIKQDPNLQNCWFLSSLTSVLSFNGAKAIQKLITIPRVDDPQNPGFRRQADFALVKLGIGTYKVPLKDILGKGGEVGTSSSKPWVRLLETAMQMHMMDLYQKFEFAEDGIGLKEDMNGGSPLLALGALLGKEVSGRISFRANIHKIENNMNGALESIQTALTNNKPVVLCSSGDLGASLKYGFSPKHAVSVQQVVPTNNGRNFLHILDPYGRSVVLDAGILERGAKVFIGEEPPNHV